MSKMHFYNFHFFRFCWWPELRFCAFLFFPCNHFSHAKMLVRLLWRIFCAIPKKKYFWLKLKYFTNIFQINEKYILKLSERHLLTVAVRTIRCSWKKEIFRAEQIILVTLFLCVSRWAVLLFNFFRFKERKKEIWLNVMKQKFRFSDDNWSAILLRWLICSRKVRMTNDEWQSRKVSNRVQIFFLILTVCHLLT